MEGGEGLVTLPAHTTTAMRTVKELDVFVEDDFFFSDYAAGIGVAALSMREPESW